MMVHRVVDIAECHSADLPGSELLRLMRECAAALGCTARTGLSEQFEPVGVTSVLILAESHLVVTTWPEHRFATVDLYTCRADIDPVIAFAPLFDALGGRVVLHARVPRTDPRRLALGARPR
jgi:S-adenosylmethionine decarboxylase proenzyme